MKTVEKMLMDLRGAHGITAEEVASAIGTTPVTISRWKNGVSKPRAKQLAAFEEFYNKNMEGVEYQPGYNARVGLGRDDAIIAMHKRGFPHPEIAEIFCISRERVRQIVAEHGEAPRRR